MSTKARTARKVVGSLAVIGAAAAVAGLGTFGTFTDSTSASTEVTSGTVSIDLAAGPVAFPVTTDEFVPGDSISRLVTLKNDGNSALAQIALAVTSSTSTVLTTDATNGLQLTLQSCSGTWLSDGNPTAPTYTCSGGTATNVVPAGGAVGTDVLTPLAGLAAGGSDQLVVRLALPTTAGNTFQGLTSTLTLEFSGTQRAGSAR
jgi:predicted ribosomally synthesized peptide with SipW-like signal peptide